MENIRPLLCTLSLGKMDTTHTKRGGRGGAVYHTVCSSLPHWLLKKTSPKSRSKSGSTSLHIVDTFSSATNGTNGINHCSGTEKHHACTCHATQRRRGAGGRLRQQLYSTIFPLLLFFFPFSSPSFCTVPFSAAPIVTQLPFVARKVGE